MALIFADDAFKVCVRCPDRRRFSGGDPLSDGAECIETGSGPNPLDPLNQTIPGDQSLVEHVIRTSLSLETQPSAGFPRWKPLLQRDKPHRLCSMTAEITKFWLQLPARAPLQWRCTLQCKDHASQYHPGIATPLCGYEACGSCSDACSRVSQGVLGPSRLLYHLCERNLAAASHF